MDIFEDFTPEINENGAEIDQMGFSFESIANEIQSFQDSGKEYTKLGLLHWTPASKQNIEKLKCIRESIFKSKRQPIAKLRNDLKVAYWVATNIESAKKKELYSLTNKLNYARGECVDLLEMYNNKIDVIADLYKRHKSLHEKFKNQANIIHRGYDNLRKTRVENIEDSSTITQLGKIIEICRSKAYSSKECESCLQTKQRNHFLKNKILILENNIEASKEQLRALEYRNMRLKSDNNIRHKNQSKLDFNVDKNKLVNEIKGRVTLDEFHRVRDSNDSSQESANKFGLAPHLAIVKRLLSDQCTLLEELTILSKDISRDEINTNTSTITRHQIR